MLALVLVFLAFFELLVFLFGIVFWLQEL